MAKKAKIRVPDWEVKNILGRSVILIKRFDRIKEQRLPFVSAMTLLGAEDGDKNYSYQNIADVIRQYDSNPKSDLAELWRRIVFSVLISNTDDHLRNHGFLRLDDHGWRLSPAYDLNPNVDNTMTLSTMIAEGDDSATLENVLSVASYFEIAPQAAQEILREVQKAVASWQTVAKQLRIPSSEINHMKAAFKV